jgi:uncharacterized protein
MSNQFTPTEEITNDDKLWALLGYIVAIIVPVIILVMEDKKNRRFLRYHAVQALASQIIFSVIAGITCGFGSVVFLIEIYFAIKAYQGEYFVIPLITDFIKKQNWVA